MKERRELVISLSVMIMLSGIAVFIVNYLPDILPSDYEITEYNAHLTTQGVLYENYTYVIHSSGKYHMLYRYWDTSLFYGKPFAVGIYLLNVSFNSENTHAIPYVKTGLDEVYVVGNVSYDSNDVNYIARKANENEVGIYFPKGITSGKYTVGYVFLLYPVIEKGNDGYHLSLTLANKHKEYKNVQIEIPNKFEVLASPYLHKTESSTETILKGEVQDDLPVNIDLFFKNLTNFSHESIKNINGDIYSQVENVYSDEFVKYTISIDFLYVFYYITLGFPILYILFHYFVGRDKTVSVEEDIFYPPKKRRPWIVNLVFKNEGGRVDQSSVLMSTLLDFQKRGIIEISTDGKIIKILKKYDESLDSYEKRGLFYLYDWADYDTLNLEKFKRIFKDKEHNKETIREIQSSSSDLLVHSKEADAEIKKFIYLPTNLLGALFIFEMLYLFVSFLYYVIAAPTYAFYILWIIFLSFVYVGQIGAMWWHPDVLGRWKDDYYREKLKWGKFREFLSNEKKVKERYSMVSDYAEDWLIYGYALGVGKKVEKVLSSPEIGLPIAKMMKKLYEYTPYIFVATFSSSGGVGGAAGGFGGGGAGVR